MTSIRNIGSSYVVADDPLKSRKASQGVTGRVNKDPSLTELRKNYQQFVFPNEHIQAAMLRLQQNSSLGSYMRGESSEPPPWIRDNYSIIPLNSEELIDAFSDQQNKAIASFQKRETPLLVIKSQDPEGNITYGIIANELRDKGGNRINLSESEIVSLVCNKALNKIMAAVQAHENMHRFTLDQANQDESLTIKPLIPQKVSQEIVVTINGNVSNKEDFLSGKEEGTLDRLTFGHTDSTQDANIQEEILAYDTKIQKAKQKRDRQALQWKILPELRRILDMFRVWIMATIAPLALKNTRLNKEYRPSNEDWARCSEAIGYRDQIIRLIRDAELIIESWKSPDRKKKAA